MSFSGRPPPPPPRPPPPPPPNHQHFGQQQRYGQHHQQPHQYSQSSYYQQQQQQPNYGQPYQQQQQHHSYQYNQRAEQQQHYYGQPQPSFTPNYGYQHQQTQPAASSSSASPSHGSFHSTQPETVVPASNSIANKAPPLVQERPVATTAANNSTAHTATTYPNRDNAAIIEPYGQVIPPPSSNEGAQGVTGLTHRSDAKRHVSSNTVGSTTKPPTFSYGGNTGASYTGSLPSAYTSGAANFFLQAVLQYQHNRIAVLFLAPPLMVVFWSLDSPYPIQTLIFLTLAMYGMDMANARDLLSVFLWVSAAILTMVTGWFLLLDTPDDQDGGLVTLTVMLRTCGNCFLFLSAAGWCTLQFEWIHSDTPYWAVSLERMLHAMLPPVAAAIFAFFLAECLVADVGLDFAATLAPHMFAVLLFSGMVFLGCAESSFSPKATKQSNSSVNGNEDETHNKDKTKRSSVASGKETHVLPTSYARAHSSLLLLVPASTHVITFRRRIMSMNVTNDDWIDLLLAWTIPYLLHYVLHQLHVSGKLQGPYLFSSSFINNILFPKSGSTLRGTFIPLVLSMVTSLAVQQRYLIPLCHQISYQFKGHDLPSAEVVSTFLSGATFFIVIGGWIWGSISTATGEPIFGEYHDDVVQLLFALAGMCGGVAFGMPWGLIPLPILAFLGLSLWLETKLLRYLAVFLFVVHATGVVLFSYRFAGMDESIELAMPGLSLNLTRFGILVVMASVLAGFLAGLAVRSTGGVGAQLMKRLDVAGALLIIYSALLAVLEFTLLTKPIPAKELAGIELDVTDIEEEDMLYDASFAYLTSCLVIVTALCMQYNKSVSTFTANVALSSAVAKAASVFIDKHDENVKINIYEASDAGTMFFRYLAAMLMIVVMFIPRAVLKPIHVKSKFYKRTQPSVASGGLIESLPRVGFARLNTVSYCFIMLPAMLVVSVPTVILPFIGACGNFYGGTYYDATPPLSVIIGYIMCFWGVASLAMVNHYLPEAGGELIKRFSALTFLMSIGLIFAAPSLPDWVFDAIEMLGKGKMPSHLLEKPFNKNPYALLSSIGAQIIRGKKSRSGGWGLVAAIFATLMAITGPLELRERKSPTGRKDKMFLFRLMTFSIMFGCGVSWFIVMQNMSEESFLVMILSAASCMAVSFFGTVAIALGYHLELDNFEEAMQVAYVWVASFPLFLLISAIPQLVLKEKVHPFGAGGWLTTYLAIYGFTAVFFSASLRWRKTKSKDTRAMGNLSSVFGFICAVSVLYGRYGVSGLDADFDAASVLGIPTSVLGTFVVSPILLMLEGENSIQGRGARLRKIAGGVAPKAKSRLIMFMNIHNLNSTTKLVPPLMGCVVVFLYASLYVILIRGSGLLFFEKVASSHEDVYKTAAAASEDTASKLEDLATLYQAAMVQNRAMNASAKLAGAGFWTSPDILGPLLHLGGVAACLPSLYLLTRYLWSGGGGSTHAISAAGVTLALPLNAVPVFLCRGIPSLQAAAWVALVGGLLQLFNMRYMDKQSKMRL